MMISSTAYTGEVHFQRQGKYATIAHQGPPDLFKVGKSYELDGSTFTVLTAEASAYVPFVTLVRLLQAPEVAQD